MHETTCTFSGLASADVYGAIGTVCRGVLPSSFLLCIEPMAGGGSGAGNIATKGDLVFTDSEGDTVTFKDCVPDKQWLREDCPDNGLEWHLRIFDRRIAWGCQHADYIANRRRMDGTVDPATKRTAKEVAEDLLDLMGEVGYDVSQVPTDIYPFVECCGPPAFALHGMLRRLAGEIVLKNDDSVACVWAGSGTDITDDSDSFIALYDLKTSVPAKVVVVCGRTVWLSMFQTEAVGLDYNSDVVEIDSLFYAPGGGWAGEWPQFFAGVSEQYRPFAFKSVYRWYRITELVGGGLKPDECDETPTAVHQLLPLLATQLAVADNLTNFDRTHEHAVYAEYWPYTDHPVNMVKCGFYSGGVDVECQNGIVRFHEPVFSLTGAYGSGSGSGAGTNGSYCPEPATVYLLCAYGIRKDDGSYIAKEFEYSVTGGDSENKRLYWPELFYAVGQTYYDCAYTGYETNLTALQAEADAIGAKWKAALEGRVFAKKLTFGGIKDVSCDGDVCQVEYRTGNNMPPETRVSLGTEGDWLEDSEAMKEAAVAAKRLLIAALPSGRLGEPANVSA